MSRKATNLTHVVSVDLYIVIMEFTRNTFIWQTQPSSLGIVHNARYNARITTIFGKNGWVNQKAHTYQKSCHYPTITLDLRLARVSNVLQEHLRSVVNLLN